MRSLSVALLACLVLAAAHPATAVDDELLPGNKLSLRQGKKRERLTVVARTGLAAPLPGSSDDPTRIGARVDVGNPLTNEWARLDAPAAGWSVNTTGTAFRFASPAPRARGSRTLKAVIRHGKGLRIAGGVAGITLDEASQGALAVVVTTGTRRYCLLFGGKVRADRPGRFVARGAPAPAACPSPSSVPTPATSTTSSTQRRPDRPTTTSTTSTTSSTGPSGIPATSSTTSSPAVTPPSSSTSTTAPAPTSTTTTAPVATTSSTTTQVVTSTSAPPPPTTTTTQPPVGGEFCDDLDVPDGHRPSSGLCRIWIPGRPPGQQSPAVPCDALPDVLPPGACLLRG